VNAACSTHGVFRIYSEAQTSCPIGTLLLLNLGISQFSLNAFVNIARVVCKLISLLKQCLYQ
jgi:hypothetical protein